HNCNEAPHAGRILRNEVGSVGTDIGQRISSQRAMRSTQALDSAGHVPGGAKNIFHYHSLKQTLKEAELSSIFEKSGVIKSEHVKDSIKIISGSDLKNPKVISELTKDGSHLQD
ncbi:hypothetical protein EBS43_11115, partial [bacterium]|nr:hypothetical protein [bacterium]